MNQNFRKFISLFSLILILNLIFIQNHVKAQSSNLEIDYLGKPGPLFTIANIKPMDSFSKTVIVTNNSDIEQNFAIRISEIIGDTPLANVLNLKVEKAGQILLDDTLSNLKNPDERFIDFIAPKTTANFDFMITMQDVGNDYQGLAIQTADFTLGFSEKGRVLGEKTEGEVAGAKLPSTGGNLALMVIYSFLISGLLVILTDKKERQKFFKKLIRAVDKSA